MNRLLLTSLSALVITGAMLPVLTSEAIAQFQPNTLLIVSAGTTTTLEDHFLDVEVNGSTLLDRLNVVWVTFHELSSVKVTDTATGAEIPARIDYGFEAFIAVRRYSLCSSYSAGTIKQDEAAMAKRATTLWSKVLARHSSLHHCFLTSIY